MNTIGHESNPLYDKSIKRSRTKARELDKPYDFRPKIWAEIDANQLNKYQLDEVAKWKLALKKLVGPFTKSEFHYSLYQIDPNKAFHGAVHLWLLRHAEHQISDIFLFIFDWWKDNGVITNNMNERLMNPLLKSGKDKRLIGSLRPLEYGVNIFKSIY